MLIFLRHGETNFNLEKKWMGRLNPPLNSLGIQQARDAAEKLRNLNIKCIYSSPLTRAHQTAAEISKKLSHCPIVIINELSERYLAEFEGIKKSDRLRIEISNSKTVEQMDDLSFRLKHALDEIQPQENTLIVSHSGVFKCLVEIMGYTSNPETTTINNGEYVELICSKRQ
ncbi:MAG: histidine phosphatase family protein [Pseudomonas sp.]